MENIEQVDIRTKRLILKELLELVELWADKPLAMQLRTILRPNKDFYNWSDKELLKKIESYRYEMEQMNMEEIEEDEEDNFIFQYMDNNPLSQLQDSVNESKTLKKAPKKKTKYKEIIYSDSSDSLISVELIKFEEKINEIYDSLDSVNPLTIEEAEERLKAVKLKMDILQKLPVLLKALEDLRTSAKNRVEDIRGGKELSPLEEGLI